MNTLLLEEAMITFALIAYLIARDQRRGVAVLLSWLVPGLGHMRLGHRSRGLFLFAIVAALFLAGLVMCDFRAVAPFAAHGEATGRHDVWALAQFFNGLFFAVTAAVTHGSYKVKDMPFYATGCLYTAVAGLLNVLVMLDAWDISAPLPATDLAPVNAAAPAAPKEGASS